MRITAGGNRGRTLRVPDIEGLRPTPSRVREALFNILGDIEGSSFLDLFSGSGIMALEALSRGASRAVSLESDRQATRAMQSIQRDWVIEGWLIQAVQLPHGLPNNTHFDVIYADPPYGQGLAELIPLWLSEHQITYNSLIIEEASRNTLHWQQGFTPTQSRKYSETTLYFFQPDIEVAI